MSGFDPDACKATCMPDLATAKSRSISRIVEVWPTPLSSASCRRQYVAGSIQSCVLCVVACHAHEARLPAARVNVDGAARAAGLRGAGRIDLDDLRGPVVEHLAERRPAGGGGSRGFSPAFCRTFAPDSLAVPSGDAVMPRVCRFSSTTVCAFAAIFLLTSC